MTLLRLLLGQPVDVDVRATEEQSNNHPPPSDTTTNLKTHQPFQAAQSYSDVPA